MALSDIKLEPYVPAHPPRLEAGRDRYIKQEFDKLKRSYDALAAAVLILKAELEP